jgi:hypothetical protein
MEGRIYIRQNIYVDLLRTPRTQRNAVGAQSIAPKICT